MDLTGKVIAILPASSGVSQRTGNPWMSQDYVIEVPGQYPKKCLFRVCAAVPPVAGAPEASPFPPQQPMGATDATSPFPPAQEPATEGSTDDLPF